MGHPNDVARLYCPYTSEPLQVVQREAWARRPEDQQHITGLHWHGPDRLEDVIGARLRPGDLPDPQRTRRRECELEGLPHAPHAASEVDSDLRIERISDQDRLHGTSGDRHEYRGQEQHDPEALAPAEHFHRIRDPPLPSAHVSLHRLPEPEGALGRRSDEGAARQFGAGSGADAIDGRSAAQHVRLAGYPLEARGAVDAISLDLSRDHSRTALLAGQGARPAPSPAPDHLPPGPHSRRRYVRRAGRRRSHQAAHGGPPHARRRDPSRGSTGVRASFAKPSA